MRRIYERKFTDKVTFCLTPELMLRIARYQRREDMSNFSRALRALISGSLERSEEAALHESTFTDTRT